MKTQLKKKPTRVQNKTELKQNLTKVNMTWKNKRKKYLAKGKIDKKKEKIF